MTRLPQVGGDEGDWGTILNNFLLVEHEADGSLKTDGTLSAKADDAEVVKLSGNQDIDGIKTFSTSPIVPDPSSASEAATKSYVDSVASSGAPDADSTTKGLIQLSGDLTGTATSPQIAAGVIVNADISGTAAIAQSKIANLTTDLASKQTADADLTAIAALTPTNDDLLQRKSGAWTNRTPAQVKTDLSLTKSDVGLSNVDNTSDANKPVSSATQAAIDAKANTADLGTAAAANISDFATATQGGKADTAVQPAAVPGLVNSTLADGSSAARATLDGVYETQTHAAATYVTQTSFWINVKSYGAVGDGTTNDTAAIQAALDAAKTAKATVYFPKGTYSVTNLTLDYSGDTAQASSGAPYGYQAPCIRGESKRGAVISQRSGATGPVLKCNGKLGTSAGPANNNKISGLIIRDLEIVGTSTGGAGLHLQSMIDCSVENIMVRNCGGSGIKIARDYFDGGTNDEYFFDVYLSNIRSMVNGGYGFECGYPAAASFTASNCNASQNTSGGWYLCTVNTTLTGCYALDNSNFGFKSIVADQSPAAPQDVSTASSLTMVGCRAENNGSAGDYEIALTGGTAPTLLGCVVFAGGGAHCIGVGTGTSGVFVRRTTIIGGYFNGNGAQAGQKFLVTGSDAQNIQVMNPRVEYGTFAGGGSLPNQLMTDVGETVSWIDNQNIIFNPAGWVDWKRQISTPGAPGAGFGRIYLKSNGGKAAIATRLGAGSEIILATEDAPTTYAGSGSPEGAITAPVGSIYMRSNGAVGSVLYLKESGTGNTGWRAQNQSADDYLRNGGAFYRESVRRTEVTAGVALTSGTMHLVALPLYPGDVVTTLDFNASVALTRGSTAGTAHLWAALYSPSGVLLSQSTDEGDSATFATGYKTFTLGAAQTITTAGIYYAALMCVAGTGGSPVQPTIRAAATGSNALSFGIGSQKPMGATNGSGLTNTAPTPITLSTGSSAPLYVIAR